MAVVAKLKCGACGQEFDTQILLEQHSQKTHGPRISVPGKLNR